MRIKIPDKFDGVSIKGAIEKVLAEAPKITAQNTTVQAPTPSALLYAEDYIILPGRKHGSYEYPDTLVEMQKSHFNKNWTDTHEGLAKEGAYMLTIRQFVDFLNLLKSGNAYDGKGKKVEGKKLNSILNEIVEVRNPYRAEWLDAYFKVVNGVLRMDYEHRFVNGKLEPLRKEDLASCLMESKTPGIDLYDWLANANYQGLPPVNVKKGKLYYYKPGKDNNSVAWFYANSVGAGLNCNGNPSYADSDLGVRRSREKI